MLARHPPRRQREIEGCNLRTARIEFQTEEIVLENRREGILEREATFLHPHTRQDRQGKYEEVSAAHAGVENAQFLGRARPAVKAACCRRSVLIQSQIGEGVAGQCRVLAFSAALGRPPCAQACFQAGRGPCSPP
jgi:hypothetical protein